MNKPAKRARALLTADLTQRQRTELASLHYFTVCSRRYIFKRRYRIYQRSTESVRLTFLGIPLWTYCAMLQGVPELDQMLAQKIALEVAPRVFFRVAASLDLFILAVCVLFSAATGFVMYGSPPLAAIAGCAGIKALEQLHKLSKADRLM